MGNVEFKQIANDSWASKMSFLNFMNNASPEIFIYGLATNTVWQLKGIINDHAVKAYLNKNYHRLEIGSYNILIRDSLEINKYL